MIKLLCLYLYLITNVAVASTAESYNSSTAQEVKAIYWLNQKQDSAIVYAKWENFNALKEFIDTVILTSTTMNTPVKLESADLLILMLPDQNKLLKVYFTDTHINMNGLSYWADPAIIVKFRQINKSRVTKGDSISSNVLNRAIQSIG